MTYDFVTSAAEPHVGGNIWQGDPCTHAPQAWRYMVERFAVRRVLDVGSGRGHAAAFFHALGCQVVAMDASRQNVQSALFPTVLHDLLGGPFVCPVDLVHCQEVAEHIPEASAGHFIDTLCNGEVIMLSHAEPGQEGYHHVNCQPPAYWIERITARGYRHLDIDTARLRHFAAMDGASHLARSGLVFARSF